MTKKALLDTNILIHREAGRVVNQDIGILFKWLDKAKYDKCVHPLSIEEIEKNPNKETVRAFRIKLDSYVQLRNTTPVADSIERISLNRDKSQNDRIDSLLLNEVIQDRVDLLISEDKQIHSKAKEAGIEQRVFTINAFLEKVVAEFPDLVNYKVLSVEKKHFDELNLNDPFFDTLKEDYEGFDKWFRKKSSEQAYVTLNNGRVLSFLYIKTEERDEAYPDITPQFLPKRRLKVGTFKVVSNGVRLGERFMKIIFDNALAQRAEEIYVTIFEKREEQRRLIYLLEEWGFTKHGTKGANGELVYARDFSKRFDPLNPKLTYPRFSSSNGAFLVPIYPDYHSELLPDSYLRTESPDDFKENYPHRNALSKVYICRSVRRDVKSGDVLIFYRTAPEGKSGYHHSVVTTIGVVEGMTDSITSDREFIEKCRKRSIFTDSELLKYWNYNPKYRPFIINFLYVHSFPLGKRLNRARLLELGILTNEKNEMRGLKKISHESLLTILKETATNESLVVD